MLLSPPAAQSFATRAILTELMDESTSYEEFRDCLIDLERVNRMVLAYRPTLYWLRQFSAPELHIVDVGCGGGDMLRSIEDWARRRLCTVQLTGIDLNPYAKRAGREFTAPSSRIQWFTCDAFSYRPAQPVDIVISSLFTHHLADTEIVRFLQWMEQTAVRGWFINDLSRSRTSYRFFNLLARMMHWHKLVQHDGPVSIQRSFIAEDWRRYVAEAGLAQMPIEIFSAWPGRLCVARVKR
jgi:SAM-dependent methyltransferase